MEAARCCEATDCKGLRPSESLTVSDECLHNCFTIVGCFLKRTILASINRIYLMQWCFGPEYNYKKNKRKKNQEL